MHVQAASVTHVAHSLVIGRVQLLGTCLANPRHGVYRLSGQHSCCLLSNLSQHPWYIHGIERTSGRGECQLLLLARGGRQRLEACHWMRWADTGRRRSAPQTAQQRLQRAAVAVQAVTAAAVTAAAMTAAATVRSQQSHKMNHQYCSVPGENCSPAWSWGGLVPALCPALRRERRLRRPSPDLHLLQDTRANQIRSPRS
jgi:hypothetical protein